MADDQTTQTGADAGAGNPTAPDAGAGADGQGAPPAGMHTQADVDRIVAQRLERDRTKAADAQAALQAKIAELEAAEKKREEADLSEGERLKKEAEEAKAGKADAEARAEVAELAATRALFLRGNAADLPAAYAQMVTGKTEAELKESLEAVGKQYAEDVQAVFRQIVTMNADQLVARFGDDAKPLAERLAGKPVSVGAPSNAGGTQPGAPTVWDPNDPKTQTPEAYAAKRKQDGLPPIGRQGPF